VEGYRHSYVEGMASILAWTQRAGPAGTLIYTSSTAVYPQGEGATIDETAATGGGERAAVLLAAEERLRAAGAGGRWFILRLAGIYGPGRHHFVTQVREGEMSGHAGQHLNLIHRDDAAEAIRACCTAPADVRNEIFNVVDDSPATKAEIGGWLARELRVAPPRFTGEPAGPRRTVTPDRIIANAKLKTLGWRPRYPTFREGCAHFLSC
jgi:nucleoside-diphosphate-sugar epimerase